MPYHCKLFVIKLIKWIFNGHFILIILYTKCNHTHKKERILGECVIEMCIIYKFNGPCIVVWDRMIKKIEHFLYLDKAQMHMCLCAHAHIHTDIRLEFWNSNCPVEMNILSKIENFLWTIKILRGETFWCYFIKENRIHFEEIPKL